ncbi:MAG: glycoside hydrolase family 31 protein [Eubacteriales bacterium]|nr:glycoside hydrolase family 31 protein [Eubacteriales bacterium]
MAANTEQQRPGVIQGERYRFTVLTSQLIRMEYAPDGVFEDRPTQTVLNRDFASSEYRVWRTGDGVEIHTEHISVYYDGQPFSPHGLWAENHSDCGGIYCTWHYGDPLLENLGGTARTLDGADGAVPLENGIQSRLQGFAVLDDSRSFALTEDGWFAPRAEGVSDLYFFSYGYQYRQALKDFYRLCGFPPLLPRYALGNWWSRFHPYSNEEYLALMDRFASEGVPLSVAVIDMDWHITHPENGGKGWTGYTWNRALFPDPPAFLQALHARGLKVTLNLHPAEGVQPHEEMYPAVAEALGKNAALRQRITFAPGDRAFMDAYFTFLHHPREAEGVDFWWVDWQQGTTSAVAGLDPLWVLNHTHTLDSARDGKRGLILSRYAGPGSHRYPIGFSGDSVISWQSLRFQPYFTATAANIGYGCWSHDIGGHAYGKRDDELQVRWLQFGVFSPILRLHSTSNPFCGKEPWRYGGEVRKTLTSWLRLRHRLMPYLYSMNLRSHTQGEPLVEPMYYEYPREEEAYRVPNQYRFGSELIVAPVTQPMDPVARLACATVWLPDGTYFDFFNNLQLEGGRSITLWRPLSQIPVLAKAGAIIPLAGEAESRFNGVQPPRTLEIRVFGGADGAFSLYEDDGESMAFASGETSVTRFTFKWRQDGATRFTLSAGLPLPFLPETRDYAIVFLGVTANTSVAACDGDGAAVCAVCAYDETSHRLTVHLESIPCGTTVTLLFAEPLALAENDRLSRCVEILHNAQMDYELKERIRRILAETTDTKRCLSGLLALEIPDAVYRALLEILLA